MKAKTSHIKLNAKELAEILKVNKLTVIKMARGKQIPCEFINGRPVFYLNKLLAYFRKLENEVA